MGKIMNIHQLVDLIQILFYFIFRCWVFCRGFLKSFDRKYWSEKKLTWFFVEQEWWPGAFGSRAKSKEGRDQVWLVNEEWKSSMLRLVVKEKRLSEFHPSLLVNIVKCISENERLASRNGRFTERRGLWWDAEKLW